MTDPELSLLGEDGTKPAQPLAGARPSASLGSSNEPSVPMSATEKPRLFSRVIRAMYACTRLIVVMVITAAALIVGLNLRPHNYPIPHTGPTQPYLDVLASRPGVGVSVDQADLFKGTLVLDMTATIPAGFPAVMVYVELSGVRPYMDFGRPTLTPADWKIVDDDYRGGYSIGHSYHLNPGASYEISVTFGFLDCQCIEISGPYVGLGPVTIDPLLLSPKQTTSEGIAITQLRDTLGPTPGLGPGKYYHTTLRSITDDEVDLDGTAISADLTQVSAIPQGPVSPDPGVWKWSNISYASATFLDPDKQNRLNNSLFYDGIALGIAGAGLLALVTEIFLVIENRKSRTKSSSERANLRKSPIDNEADLRTERENSNERSANLVSEREGLKWQSASMFLFGAAAGIVGRVFLRRLINRRG